MKTTLLTLFGITFAATGVLLAAEDDVIKEAMKFAHKAPKGEKKLSDKIADGTASEEDVKKALDLYKKMADSKPPKGDQAAFRERVSKLVAATEELVSKNPEGVSHYKEVVNCKACHSEFKAD